MAVVLVPMIVIMRMTVVVGMTVVVHGLRVGESTHEVNVMYRLRMSQTAERLWAAARDRDLAKLKALLTQEPKILDAFDAAAFGRTTALQKQLEADPRAALSIGPDGLTALHLAAFFGRTAAVELLLRHRAEVDARARNASLIEPLHAAIAGGHAGVARLLVAAGARVDAILPDGSTPLHLAAAAGSAEIVALLLKLGADKSLKNRAGQSPGDLARAAGQARLAAVL